MLPQGFAVLAKGRTGAHAQKRCYFDMFPGLFDGLIFWGWFFSVILSLS